MFSSLVKNRIISDRDAAVLLQKNRVGLSRETFNSLRMLVNHISSSVAKDMLRYSASTKNFDITCFFLDFHVMREESRNIHSRK